MATASSGTPEAVRFHQLSGFHVITGNGTDGLQIAHEVVTGTSFIKGKGIVAIPLDALTENTDYWQSVGNGDTNEASSTGAFTNVRSATPEPLTPVHTRITSRTRVIHT